MRMDTLRLIGSQSVDLPLAGEDESGPFVFKSAEGLGAPEMTARMARGVLQKAVPQGKSIQPRQLIILIGLQPNWDVGERPDTLRKKLYSLLTPRYNKLTRVEIVYEGVVQAFAQGYVSKMESGIFTKDPAVQITIDTDDGYLLAPRNTQQMPPQRNLGGGRAFDIEYPGDAPNGFRMAMTLRSAVGNSLVFSENHPDGLRIQLDGINWVAGDKLQIDTREGSRGIWRARSGTSAWVSCLSALNVAASNWLTLHEGTNTYLINATAFDWDTDIQFTYRAAFWGL